ncbi:hypothetical protein EVAR_88783_1 [Eumeta japonica]|uniref:Uncharacterized protein n=1 Tax=Eumeta variegata TaxID=151549 RepID=A0A4C1XW10_EUMVA|nr:hypothetical protein EVAR_88783_1 [Eumeta japonica]
MPPAKKKPSPDDRTSRVLHESGVPRGMCSIKAGLRYFVLWECNRGPLRARFFPQVTPGSSIYSSTSFYPSILKSEFSNLRF